MAAEELTNTHESAQGLLKFDLRKISEHIECSSVFFMLDEILERHLKEHSPLHSKIDDVVHSIELFNGTISIAESAAIYGKSIRQFERVFRETVGVTAKLFSEITRFRRASSLIPRTTLSLAQIAAELGYTDQSHMNREFKRFTDLPPASYARSHVVFLQDQRHGPADNGVS